jgi:hypothetical protein
MGRSIGGSTKFCQVDGVLVGKIREEMYFEINLNDGQIFMAELSKIASSIIPMLKTEADFPSDHSELNKVPILDIAVWVEEMLMSASGMEDDPPPNQ